MSGTVAIAGVGLSDVGRVDDLGPYELIAQETIDAEEFDRLFNGGETKSESAVSV